MEFNKLVIDNLWPIFEKYNYIIVDQFKNQVEFKSDKIAISISYYDLDRSNSLSISQNENFSYPIDENILKKIFSSSLKIDKVIPEVFVKNLVAFFVEKGRSLLQGNTGVLDAIRKHVDQESKEYTGKLLNKQNLEEANKAWDKNEHRIFITHIDKMGLENLPNSYQLKYRIAQKKLGSSL